MKKMVIAAALLLLAATASFASDEDKEKWPPPPSASPAQERNILAGNLTNPVKGEKLVVSGLFCVTGWGPCPLKYPMWDGSTCTCYWSNGTWSVGIVE